MITALIKAESLQRFATSQGAPLKSFVLCLSTVEGLELLDWFVEQNEANELLDMDVAMAHRTKDPWRVLEYFQLMGFEIKPSNLVLN